MSNLNVKIVSVVILILMLLIGFSSNILATDDSNRNTIPYVNTVNTDNTDNTDNNTINNNVSNYNNTTNTTTLPKTGIDYSIFVIIGICIVSAVYSYIRIRKYRI